MSNNLADVLSLSYGACEQDFGDADTAFYTNVWAQAAAQGISVLVASGDSGAAGLRVLDATTSSSAERERPRLVAVRHVRRRDAVPRHGDPVDVLEFRNDPTTKKSVEGLRPRDDVERERRGRGGGGN